MQVRHEVKATLSRAKLVARVGGCIAIAISALVLIGWVWDIDRLKRLVPGLVSMNPMTAVAFILISLSLLLQLHPKESLKQGVVGLSWRFRFGQIGAILVLIVGLLRLIGYLLPGYDAHVDQILFSNKLAGDVGAMPNRMAPNTALAFLLAALSLLLLDRTSQEEKRPTEYFSFAVLIISFFGLVGYFFGIKQFIGVGDLIPMALHTAVVFQLLAIGILCARPNQGLMAIILSEGPSGVIVSRLFPGVVFALGVLSWLRYELEHTGHLDSKTGVTLLVVTSILLFGALMAKAAREISLLERTGRQLQRDRDLFFYQPLGLFAVCDDRGHFLQINSAFTEQLGFLQEELLSKPFTKFVHPDDIQHTFAELEALSQGKSTAGFENRYATKEGSWRIFSWRCYPVPEEKRIYAAAQDVTELRAAECALSDSERHLDITLRSISEAVLCTDLEGHVTRLNLAAEKLAGWRQGEAIGRSFDEVFQIIDEGTLESARLPVADTLADGGVHSFAEHTVLTSRDGRQYSIAGSCAPIQTISSEWCWFFEI